MSIDTNPIVDNQKWINQIGYEGNFAPSSDSLILRHLLLGGGLGLTAGAIKGENMWTPAWRTAAGAGIGSALGYYTGSPSDQSTNATIGALLGGGAGMASAYAHDHKKEKGTVNLPGLTLQAKTGSFQDVLDKVKEQLPTARIPDMTAGAAVGGGLGWLYNKVRKDPKLNETEQHKQKWKRIIAGAGLGAAVANLAGDRARRYISNTIIPFSYENSIAPSNPESTAKDEGPTSLMHPTLKKVWDAGILDKPQQPGVADYLAGKYKAPFSFEPNLPLNNTSANTAARRELLRIGMGIKTPESNSIWKQQPDSTYSLNPQHKNVNNLLQEFLYPKPGSTPDFTQDPQGSIADLNQSPNWDEGLMTPISGGQRVPLFTYKGEHGNDYLARFLKKWNVDLRDYEKENVVKYLKDKYLHHVANPKLDLNVYPEDKKPADQLKSLGKRWALEHLVMKNSPWVSQRMYFKQMPSIGNANGEISDSYAAIPSTASGELYPGASIGMPDRNTGDTGFRTLQQMQHVDDPLKNP